MGGVNLYLYNPSHLGLVDLVRADWLFPPFTGERCQWVFLLFIYLHVYTTNIYIYIKCCIQKWYFINRMSLNDFSKYNIQFANSNSIFHPPLLPLLTTEWLAVNRYKFPLLLRHFKSTSFYAFKDVNAFAFMLFCSPNLNCFSQVLRR